MMLKFAWNVRKVLMASTPAYSFATPSYSRNMLVIRTALTVLSKNALAFSCSHSLSYLVDLRWMKKVVWSISLTLWLN